MDISGHELNTLLALSVLITLSSVCVNIANLTSHDNLWSPGSQYWHSASAFSRRPCDTGLRYLTLSHVFYFIWRNSTLSLVYKLHTLRGAGKLFAIITTRNMASAAVRELLLSLQVFGWKTSLINLMVNCRRSLRTIVPIVTFHPLYHSFLRPKPRKVGSSNWHWHHFNFFRLMIHSMFFRSDFWRDRESSRQRRSMDCRVILWAGMVTSHNISVEA